jgi:signal transduction histidine kinase
MDPGSKAFWHRHWQRTLLATTVISGLLASAIVLGALGARAKAGEGIVHITQAQLAQGGVASQPVAAGIDEADLAGPWSTIGLPVVFAPDAGPASVPADVGQTRWFRARLDAGDIARGPLHLYLPRWFAHGRLAIYGDGRLLYRSAGSAGAPYFFRPAVLLALDQADGVAPPSTLLIRLDAHSAQPAALSSIYIGASAPILRMAAARDWLDRQLPFAGGAAFMLVGLFSLTVWLYRRRPQNMCIVAMAVLGAVRLWHVGTDTGSLPVADAWLAWLVLNALLWQVMALQFFLRLHLPQAQPRFNRALPWAALALSVLTLPVAPQSLPGIPALQLHAHVFVMCVVAAVGTLSFWNAWRSRWLQGWAISGVYLFLVLCGVWDWTRLFILHDVEGHDLSAYAGFVLFLTFTISMFARYLTVLNQIEIVNAGLEQRLEKREAELAESYEKLRWIEQRQTLNDERQRLTQDMHDGLGSSLVSALRVVEGGRLSKTDVAEVLKGCIDDLKLTIDSLEPVEADLLLLLATLRFRLGPRLAGAGVSLRWEISDVPLLDWLDPRNALHILRILQESFANILKHTKASEIRVATGVEGGGVSVVISDNGQGFSLESALQKGGKGLQNQQRRAQSIGGEIRWHSDGSGTRVTLWLPEKRPPG